MFFFLILGHPPILDTYAEQGPFPISHEGVLGQLLGFFPSVEIPGHPRTQAPSAILVHSCMSVPMLHSLLQNFVSNTQEGMFTT